MKRWVIIAVVGVLIVGTIYFFYFLPGRYTGPEFPRFFPKEMISDSYIVDLEVLEDDAGKLDGEARRATISYKSHRSLEDNLQDFKSYFETNNFSLIDIPTSIPGQTFLAAKKDKTSISVTFWKRSPLEISILYITTK